MQFQFRKASYHNEKNEFPWPSQHLILLELSLSLHFFPSLALLSNSIPQIGFDHGILEKAQPGCHTYVLCTVHYITFLPLSVEFQPKIRGVLTEIAKQIVCFSLRAIIS